MLVRQREDRIHVVLDQHDRKAAFELTQGVDQARGFIRPHAGHGFVEQQKPRLGDERHRDLELAALAVTEVGDEHIGTRGKPEAIERGLRRVTERRLAPRVAPEAERVAGMAPGPRAPHYRAR